MRLFELSKLSLSGTGKQFLLIWLCQITNISRGYKLRQQISKALQWHSETICKAIAHYNVKAAALNPPHDKISWKDIADYSLLAKFDFLWHSRNDVHDDWARPAYREATSKYFKLLRAHEEITQLNVEILRLRTAIYNEELHVTAIICDLSGSDPLLASELKRQWHSGAAINAVHNYCLDQIGSLMGFSGVLGVGTRLDTPSTTMNSERSAPSLDDEGAPSCMYHLTLHFVLAYNLSRLREHGRYSGNHHV